MSVVDIKKLLIIKKNVYVWQLNPVGWSRGWLVMVCECLKVAAAALQKIISNRIKREIMFASIMNFS
jgi:hypothetical protein